MDQSPRPSDSQPEESNRRTAPTVVVASRYGTLWALDSRDGSIRWRLSPTGRKPILVHGGDVLYVSSHIPLAAFREPDHYNEAPDSQVHPRPVARAAPTDITALRISDGTTIWQQEGWSAPSAPSGAIVLDGDLLLGEGPVQVIGDAHIHAFDARSGAIRWTHAASLQAGTLEHLLAARAGRVLILSEEVGPRRRLDVLDAHSGNTLWSKQAEPGILVSHHGSLVALTPAASYDLARTIHNINDGQQIAALPPQSRLLALSDDGIAYLAGYAPKPRASSAQIYSGQAATPIVHHLPIPTISAVRLRDGTELWRADHVDAGIITTTANTLYSARFAYRHRAEVTALDIHTGKLLWRWQTPGNLFSLLRLWGTRIPQVLIYALAQARRSFIRARENHDSGIIRREIINGQWRRPTHLVSNVHLAAHADAVYLATSLGLFALHPRDGHLLWHALPTSELVDVVASP